MKPVIKYYYRGQVERGTGSGYRWLDGYSENSDDGSVLYPWMTVTECAQDAKKRGGHGTIVRIAQNPHPIYQPTQSESLSSHPGATPKSLLDNVNANVD